MNKVRQGQHEVMVDAPAVPTAGISSKQGRQEVCKGPGAGLLVGYAELVQGLHQRCHHLYPHGIALIAQQVQKRPASRKSRCQDCFHCSRVTVSVCQVESVHGAPSTRTLLLASPSKSSRRLVRLIHLHAPWGHNDCALVLSSRDNASAFP